MQGLQRACHGGLAASQACSTPFSWADLALSIGQPLEAQQQRTLPAQWAPPDGRPQVLTARVLC